MKSFKDIATEALQKQDTNLGFVTEIVLGIINLAACIIYVLESYEWSETTLDWYHVAEWMLVSVFAIEFGLRLWTAEKKTAYIFSFYGIVDILSIVPVLLTFEGAGFVRGLKLLRLFRVLRLARLLRKKGIFAARITDVPSGTVTV